jgi:hypothetical protein
LVSDVDIALVLMPPEGKHNWALGNLCDFGDEWVKQLEAIVGCKVDLCQMQNDPSFDAEVRKSGKLLWARA